MCTHEFPPALQPKRHEGSFLGGCPHSPAAAIPKDAAITMAMG